MENEAQLATVLGHESTHFLNRHAVKEMRSANNKAAFASALQVIIASPIIVLGGGQSLGDLSGRIRDLWVLSSVNGYSRELETEADEHGLSMMVLAGYDPKEAPKVFELLQQDLEERKIKEPFFFGTHPMLQDRIENYNRLISTEYSAQAKEAGRLINSEEFQKRTEGLLLDNAILDLRIARSQTAKAAIEKYLKRKPDDAHARFLLGEVYRQESDAAQAIIAYEESARLDPAYAEPHRELGLIYRAQGRTQAAITELGEYLALSPNSVDVPIIKGYLSDLEKR